MQFSLVALTALVATAAANYNASVPVPVSYTTETVTKLTTVCPYATQVTYGGVTYTATASQTLTITNCPCTVVKPVYTSSVVVCKDCPSYTNATAPYPSKTPVYNPTTAAPVASASKTPLQASSGSKTLALSGASLAGLLGLVAYFL